MLQTMSIAGTTGPERHRHLNHTGNIDGRTALENPKFAFGGTAMTTRTSE
jgi:hypothetical protein